MRITKEKGKLTKGYKPNFTEETFIVTEQLNRVPPVYRLKDEHGEPITGIFYSSELTAYNGGNVYKSPAKRRKRQ